MRQALSTTVLILAVLCGVGLLWCALAREAPQSNIIVLILDADDLTECEKSTLVNICREADSARCLIDVPEHAALEMQRVAQEISQTAMRMRGNKQGVW